MKPVPHPNHGDSPAMQLRKAIHSGFTLIELLMVITVMALLLSLTANISQEVVDSMNFRQALQNIKSQLESARQMAMTTNRNVMVRLIESRDELGNIVWNSLQIGSADVVTEPGKTGYQTPVVGNYEFSFKPLKAVENLPTGFVFHPSSTYSTLLSAHPNLDRGETTMPDGEQRKYVAFAFQPDGRCTLQPGEIWTLTLIRDKDLNSETLPRDYATIQIDPRTARARVYRR